MDTISFQLFLLVCLIVFMAFWTKKAMETAKKQQAAWRSAAARLGLELDPTAAEGSRPMLQGAVDGHAVEIEVIRRGSGKSSVRYTVVRSQFPGPVPAGLSLTQSTFFSEVRSSLGGQDIPLADGRLDRALVVQGRHPASVQALLDRKPVRKAMRRFFRNDAHSRVEGRNIIADRKGFLADAELDGMVSDTLAVVRAVTEARGRAWKDLAAQHGLTFEEIGPAVRLIGERNGGAVRVETWNGETTTLTIEVPGLDPHIRIVAGEGGFVASDQILGGRVCITGQRPVLVARFGPAQLDALRGELMQVFQTWPTATVGGGAVRITLPEEPYSTLDAVLGDLGLLAVALGQSGSG